MFREAVCCCVMLALVGSGGPAIAGDMTVQQVKDKVRQMEERRVNCKVKMKDGTLLQGRIVQSSNESFTVTGRDGPRTVSYADVAEVHKKGLHPAAGVAIVVGVVVGALFGVYAAMCGTGGCH